MQSSDVLFSNTDYFYRGIKNFNLNSLIENINKLYKQSEMIVGRKLKLYQLNDLGLTKSDSCYENLEIYTFINLILAVCPPERN